MRTTYEMFIELNQTYNDLGEDLLMLEAVLMESDGETGFPVEYLLSSKRRLWDYICQHTKEIQKLTKGLIFPQRAIGPIEDLR